MLLLTTTRDALLAPLQSVAGIVEKRHTLPILSNVLIEKHADQLTMLATDIEIQIRTTTGGHIGGEDASITVGARKLQDILRALPDSAEISLTLDDKRLTVKAGRSRFQLQTLPAADYPRLNPPTDAAAHLSIGQRTFKRQLAQVAASASGKLKATLKVRARAPRSPVKGAKSIASNSWWSGCTFAWDRGFP